MIKNGSKIKICYTARGLDGELLDATPVNEPISFLIGGGELPEEIEKNLIGMTVGEKKKIIMTPDKLFGEWSEENVLLIPKELLPAEVGEIQPSKFIDLKDNNGNMFRGFVLEINEKGYVIDFNHPFAGKTIEYNIEIVAVEQ
ncbi:MAG: FKBP-type peptidyl-prolyl cis-trans isomerase [Calditerrivibrio sp.]|nr:FKBP-type peptidyl-prolyl cis-trans isomerase [Calditerrivibrio sp.]